MSGINIVNIYATTIFEDIQKASTTPATLTPTACSYFIGIAGITGAIISAFTCLYLTRRMVFIGGHVLMGISLVGVAVFINLNMQIPVLICMCCMIIAF